MTIDALTLVRQSLLRYRRKSIAVRLIENIVKAAALGFVFLTAVQLLFAVIPLTLFPFVWDGAIGLFVVAAIVLTARHCLFCVPPLLVVADRAEKQRNCSPRWLSLALELQLPLALGSRQLKNEVAARAAAWLEQNPHLQPKAGSKKIAVFLCLAAAAWGCTAMFVKPRCGAFWDLPLSLGSPIAARILPGGTTLPMRSSIQLRCIPKATTYPSCRLTLQDLGGAGEQTHLLRPDSRGAFSFTRDSLTRSFSYRFSIGMTPFPPETVHVAAPPSLYGIRIRIIPPAYCGLAPMLLGDGQGSFSALAGSSARFSITAQSPLSRAVFCPSAGDSVRCVVNGSEAVAQVMVRRSCDYTFSLVDTLGQKSDSTPSYFIDLTADAPPSITFLKPAMNKELSPALSETLCVEAHDDFGIRQCSFNWRKSSEDPRIMHSNNLLTGNTAQPFLRREMAWDIRELSLYPGDTVFYWAYARDNDPFDTTHHCVTETFWLRLPSFDEINRQLTQQQSVTDQSLQSAQRQQDLMKNQLGNLLKSTRGKQELTWEQKQILADLKESLKAQSDTLTKAIESLNRTVEQLKKQGLSSREMLEKMDKVKKALEDIARQYGDSVLFQPPRKDETMGMEDLKNALEKFKRALPDLAGQLDNALKYLEMLKKDQRLGQLAQRAEHYGNKQLDIASGSLKPQGKLDEQKELTKNMENLLSDITQKSEADAPDAPLNTDNMPAFQPAQSELRAMHNNLNENALPAQTSMDRMAAGMFSLAQNLRDMQSSAMMRKQKKEQEVLTEMAHDALSMAAWQKELEQGEARRPSRTQTAKAQQSLKLALAKSAENLDRLSMVPPQTLRSLMSQFSEAAGSMDKSLAALQNEQDAAQGMEEGGQALSGLAYSLLDASGDMDGGQAQGQGNAMGEMMGGFQRLSGKQAMINAATGELLRQMLGGQGKGEDGGRQAGEVGGGRGSAEAEKARREAQAAQKAVADALQKLSDAYGKEAGNGMETKAKDLEQEARRLAKMLENPQPELQDHQQRFLSRMLQTTLSMHKQDEGKEQRQSQSAKNAAPSDIQKSTGNTFNDRDSFFRMRQKAFSGNFPESYRGALRAYFDTLGTLFLKEK